MLYVIYKEAIYKIDVFRSEREFSNAFNVFEYFADLLSQQLLKNFNIVINGEKKNTTFFYI